MLKQTVSVMHWPTCRQIPHTCNTFRPPSATVVSAESFSHGTGTLRYLQKEMAIYRHWPVSLWRDPEDALTLSNPVPWQNWMAAYLRMKMLFRGWPVMVHDKYTRRRRSGRKSHTGFWLVQIQRTLNNCNVPLACYFHSMLCLPEFAV